MTFPSTVPPARREAYDGLQWVPFRELFDLSAIQRCYGRTVELEQVIKAGGKTTKVDVPEKMPHFLGENETRFLGVELKKGVGLIFF